MKEIYLEMSIWLCEVKLKVKIAHFRLRDLVSKTRVLKSPNVGQRN